MKIKRMFLLLVIIFVVALISLALIIPSLNKVRHYAVSDSISSSPVAYYDGRSTDIAGSEVKDQRTNAVAGPVETLTESSQQRQDVSEAESSLAMEQTLHMSDDIKYVDESAKPEFIGTPMSVTPTQPADPQDVALYKRHESQEISRYSVVRGPALTEEKLEENSIMSGKRVLSYE
jgi:hypothetical protein